VLLVPGRPRALPQVDVTRLTFAMAFGHMWAKRGVYGLLIGYVTFGAMLVFGKGAWMPALIGRTWDLDAASAGVRIGALNLTCGPLGMLFGGYVMDRLAATGRDIRSYGLCAGLIATISVVLLPHMPTLNSMLAGHAVSLAFAGVFYVVGAATLAEITPQHMMGKITAAYLLLQGTASQTLGPLLIAALADTVFSERGAAAIGFGMSTASALIGTLSLGSLWLLMRQMRRRAVT
jgi:MFS transporter, Spinster family, sphingosine-1-phosphate transporter